MLIARERYVRGKSTGDWQRWDAAGKPIHLTRYVDGEQLFELEYQEGAPLVPVPAATACDAQPAMRKLAFGDKLPREECLQRMQHFPGFAQIGSFAYDRGCMPQRWLIHCKVSDKPPTSKQLLASAGWARARGPAREVLAMAFVNEVELHWNAYAQQDPDPPAAKAASDGSVVVTAWTAVPGGMRPDDTITLQRWTFRPDGTMTSDVVKQGTRKPPS